ncbi:glutamate 5-kinase [Thermomonas sp. XSG]|uniref:glutamate 5-kinase n=1 Tax=Thermomonas sp. XSG TaxID=2771436 RepID=UPI0016819F2E|nr:glutamate 5-kinase [Thermomonas sp. XSG]QNU16106.1 glutamate 5-kinase [Thermomonas sp. XSG]
MDTQAFPAQILPPWKRAVLKVGSSLLAAEGGGLSPRFALGLAQFVLASRQAGREVVIVSSGAVAAGRAVLPRAGGGAPTIAAKQALAALGQAQLIGLWQRFFEAPVAQVLLTHEDLRDRRRYLNARSALLELLRLGAVPVVNENDTVAVDELKLGDNDNLAAAVASLVDAELLLIATDIAGLYSGHPGQDPDAQPVARVETITPAVLAMAGDAGALGTGGMRTKLEAAAKAATAGISTALFSGRDATTVAALGQGRLHGTLVDAQGSRLRARKQWLRHAPAAGALKIDAGACAALLRGASLLPGGVRAVAGDFRRGDVIEVRAADGSVLARGQAQYNAQDGARIAGRHSREIEAVLGFHYNEAMIHRDDLVLLQAAGPSPIDTNGETTA